MHNLATLNKCTTLRRFFALPFSFAIFPPLPFVHCTFFFVEYKVCAAVCVHVCVLVVHQIKQYGNLTENFRYIISRTTVWKNNYHELSFPAHCGSIILEHAENLESQLQRLRYQPQGDNI